MDGTLLEQLAGLVTVLNQVKTLCDGLIAAASEQQAKYSGAVAAQADAGASLANVMDLAAQISGKIGG